MSVDSSATPADAASRRLLLVHAHPDDETIGNGATMARYAADGAHVTLVTCTLGEQGEILVPELAHLAADQEDRLAQHRTTELRDAMRALGVTDYRLLGGAGRYRDSGMMGTAANDRPDSFWRTDVDEAAGLLVTIIREIRPQVLLTYDSNGGYGHPDHIQAHRVAMRAVELAADPACRPDTREPHHVAKVYWNCMPRSVIQEGMDRLAAEGKPFPFEGIKSADDIPGAVDDALVSCAVDGTAYAAAKFAAMRSYPTQISVAGPFFALADDFGQETMAHEFYRLVQGRSGAAPGGREDDLFAGLGI